MSHADPARALAAARRDPGDPAVWAALARASEKTGRVPEGFTAADLAVLELLCHGPPAPGADASTAGRSGATSAVTIPVREPRGRPQAAVASTGPPVGGPPIDPAAARLWARAQGLEPWRDPARVAGAFWRDSGRLVAEDGAFPFDRVTGLPLGLWVPRAGLDLVFVPPGRYPVGHPDPAIVREVWPGAGAAAELGRVWPGAVELVAGQRYLTLTTGFYLGRTPVTQAQYRARTGAAPSFRVGDRRPVERVSAGDALEFCAGLTGGDLRAGWAFGLPDSARWEVALRAGGPPVRADAATGWFRETARGTTHPVASRAPSAFGTYDQLGNVGEWSSDVGERFDEHQGAAWPTRAVLGGDWSEEARWFSSSRRAARYEGPPYGGPRASVGFRVFFGPAAPGGAAGVAGDAPRGAFAGAREVS